ncbi:hypothetical protein EMIHUDRAFT_465316 [Emiliania huxleyi CCMP1516]|uniref:Opine dehydrogenase domain-containing protein n=2 Tax=Emiliania huxleyi TaxID=2903 RepID=A0A0D3IFE8_EMIH1|nr:hypothetical protein EMIHUDRAFT_465316 [Emiliania huxleyi CCMP1516]EOD09983.1 hypothetical protein EMIHUDRAFT_465316 [Emiliania huxleyi CCMP1516]|eukprot:XP_005762412.1 hypothetical protein EMIHUDRAFT_465316 [Emiliania huxleyi CCMP1516]
MHITVVGGGNSTPIFAALAKDAGHEVAILTRRPADWNKDDIGFVNEDLDYFPQAELRVGIDLVTDDPALCIPQTDLIFIAGLPIHHNPTVLARIRPHLDMQKKVFIGSICAYGGFNWVAAEALGPGNYSLFGTQLIPWCCGTLEYGRTGLVIGAKRLLRIATEDGRDSDGVKPILAKILKMPFLTDTDFIASTLWPNNPSLHPPILYGLFKDWDGKSPYDPDKERRPHDRRRSHPQRARPLASRLPPPPPSPSLSQRRLSQRRLSPPPRHSGRPSSRRQVPTLIYKDLRTDSAVTLVEMDTDLCAIVAGLRGALPQNGHLVDSDFSMKACVMQNYEEQITCAWDTVSCIMSNKAFAKHRIPYTAIEGGVVPTLAHKFFETDLPFGLCTMKDIANMVGVAVPCIDKMILWNQKLIGKEYLTASGKIDGKHASECVLPSAFGLDAKTLEFGNRSRTANGAEKKQKT